jgi:hypothetical protein
MTAKRFLIDAHYAAPSFLYSLRGFCGRAFCTF